MNQNIQLIKIYNLYVIFFQYARYLKEIMLCSTNSIWAGAHPFILVLTASEYPVTTEVLYFYFHQDPFVH